MSYEPTNVGTGLLRRRFGYSFIQYIMGVSQQTVSIFWWVTDGNIASNTDPFLAWILAVADETDPPKVNSISYGVSEKVCFDVGGALLSVCVYVCRAN